MTGFQTCALPMCVCVGWGGGGGGGGGCVCGCEWGWGRVELNLYDAGPWALGDTAEGQHQFLAHQTSNFSPFHTCCSK